MVRSKQALAVIAAILLGTGVVPAEQVNTTWLGGSGLWTNPSNWSGGVVPNKTATQTFNVLIPTGSVGFSAPGAPSIQVSALSVTAGASLYGPQEASIVVNDAFRLDGRFVGSVSRLTLLPDASLTGSGTLHLLNSSLSPSAGSSAGFGVPARITVVGDYGFFRNNVVGRTDTSLTNVGTLMATANVSLGEAALTLSGSTFRNDSEILAVGAARVLFDIGRWRMSDIGNAARIDGATFVIGGTLDNTNRSLNFGPAHGNWEIAGTVRGGSINIATGTVLRAPSSYSANNIGLHDTELNGHLRLYDGDHLVTHDGAIRGTNRIELYSPNLDGWSRIYSSTDSLTTGENTVIQYYGGGIGDLEVTEPNYLNSGIGDRQRLMPIENRGRIVATSIVHPTYPSFDVLAIDGDFSQNARMVLGEKILARVRGDFTSGRESLTVIHLTRNESPVLQDFVALDVQHLDLTSELDHLRLIPPSDVFYGEVFRIAKFQSFSGSWRLITTDFQLYGGGGYLLARYVPEPRGQVAMTGVLAILCRRRRACGGCVEPSSIRG